MLWHIVKYYLTFVITVFFKRHKISNIKNIQVKGPVILAMNHPNAFMDPVAFSSMTYPPRVRYLARGDAFKKGIVTWILESLGIIPIFRMQDAGKDGLMKNNETYQSVNKLLSRNKKIIIFAEGICIQERRLRPLKKGVPRMVFGAMNEFDLNDLTVVPIGINYSNPSQFRSKVFFNIGEPIHINDYMSSYQLAPAKTMNSFLVDLAAKMKSLIIHINHIRSETVIGHLEIILKSDYFKKNKWNVDDVEHDFLFSMQLVDVINKGEDHCPEVVAELTTKTTAYFEQLETYKLRDWLIDPLFQQKRISYFLIIWNCFLIITTLPIYIVGLLTNFVPYKLSYVITTRKVKVKEFKASFYMGIGAVLFLLNYSMLYTIPSVLYSAWLGVLVVIISFLCGYACLYISPLRKKTKGMWRVLNLQSKQKTIFDALQNQRHEIIKEYETLL
jgi:glycerol-3-phosphate O-acyltransferase/dihydroxyacetone phosphate acyltransferase